MNFQVVISRRAHEELLGAADWWAENRDADQAAKWFVGFDEKLKSLSHDPRRFSLAKEDPDFQFEIRQLNYGVSKNLTHRAIFTILEPDIVFVLTIQHLAQDRLQAEEFLDEV